MGEGTFTQANQLECLIPLSTLFSLEMGTQHKEGQTESNQGFFSGALFSLESLAVRPVKP